MGCGWVGGWVGGCSSIHASRVRATGRSTQILLCPPTHHRTPHNTRAPHPAKPLVHVPKGPQKATQKPQWLPIPPALCALRGHSSTHPSTKPPTDPPTYHTTPQHIEKEMNKFLLVCLAALASSTQAFFAAAPATKVRPRKQKKTTTKEGGDRSMPDASSNHPPTHPPFHQATTTRRTAASALRMTAENPDDPRLMVRTQ